MSPDDPSLDRSRHRLVAIAAVAVLVAVVAVAALVIQAGADRSVEVGDEFEAEITAMNDRSVCIAERDDDASSCGIPVLSDRNSVKVGDTVLITTMQLVEPDGTKHEAWYVRKP